MIYKSPSLPEKTKIRSISITPSLLQKGEDRRWLLKKSFSQYVCELIASDVAANQEANP